MDGLDGTNQLGRTYQAVAPWRTVHSCPTTSASPRLVSSRLVSIRSSQCSATVRSHYALWPVQETWWARACRIRPAHELLHLHQHQQHHPAPCSELVRSKGMKSVINLAHRNCLFTARLLPRPLDSLMDGRLARMGPGQRSKACSSDQPGLWVVSTSVLTPRGCREAQHLGIPHT